MKETGDADLTSFNCVRRGRRVMSRDARMRTFDAQDCDIMHQGLTAWLTTNMPVRFGLSTHRSRSLPTAATLLVIATTTTSETFAQRLAPRFGY